MPAPGNTQERAVAAHTPGPWAVSKNSSGRRVTSATGVVICNAVLRNTGRADRKINHGSKSHMEAKANACLIAAAPDLLEALDMCRAIIKFHVKNAQACCSFSPKSEPFSALEAHSRAVAAIAKARGQ